MAKHKVVMTNVVGINVDDGGNITTAQHQATDYVPEEDLEAYVADARTRWQSVVVSDSEE